MRLDTFGNVFENVLDRAVQFSTPAAKLIEPAAKLIAPAVQLMAPAAQLIAPTTEIVRACTKVSRYNLEAHANLPAYYVYRLWNAVKAIFDQSDWQCARRDLIEIGERDFKVLKIASYFIKDLTTEKVADYILNNSLTLPVDKISRGLQLFGLN